LKNRIPEYFRHGEYAITGDDVARLILKCAPDQIMQGVLMTPAWPRQVLLKYVDSCSEVVPNRVFTLVYAGRRMTLIRSGIGAPLTGDVVLALGCTPCQRVMFVGSVGGLLPSMKIGDLVLVTASAGGDGFSTYLADRPVGTEPLVRQALPDPEFTRTVEGIARPCCERAEPALLKGQVYSSDTIVAEFHHLEEIAGRLGCIGIEMETAALFNAAALVGIRTAALLQISDVIPARKSLFSGRTAEDRERRHRLREQVLARIALEALAH
jgi:purine-nucleoside phosphorylase